MSKPPGDNYQVRTRRLVSGFNYPIDAEIIGNQIYVIEWGRYGIFEVTLPSAPKLLSDPRWSDNPPQRGFSVRFDNVTTNQMVLERSTNLLDWIGLTNLAAGKAIDFFDPDSANSSYRFYRARETQ